VEIGSPTHSVCKKEKRKDSKGGLGRDGGQGMKEVPSASRIHADRGTALNRKRVKRGAHWTLTKVAKEHLGKGKGKDPGLEMGNPEFLQGRNLEITQDWGETPKKKRRKKIKQDKADTSRQNKKAGRGNYRDFTACRRTMG